MKHNNAGNTTLVANDAERILQPQENARIGANDALAGLASVSVLIAIIAFLLRAFRIDQAIDLHIDEIYYLGISHSLEKSVHPTFNGLPFYIHPPAFFIIESLYFRVMHLKGNQVHEVFAARYINILLSSICAGAFFVIGYSVARWRAGLLAASFLALDPFIVRINGWNILETPAIFWVVLGYTLIFPAMANERSHLPVWRAVIAGCAFGIAMLTKETTAFLTLFPLTVCFILHWSLTRRTLVAINMVTVSCYGIYVAIATAIGDWRYFQDQKLSSLSRFIGVTKPTGFVPGFARKPTAPSVSDRPSLLDAIISNLERLGTTYVLLGTGLIAVCILVKMGGARRRLLATWTACAYALIVYSILFGTLEEQFFYFVVPSSILSTVVAGALLFRAEAWPSLFMWPAILGRARRRPNFDDIRANVAYVRIVKVARAMFAGVVALIMIWSIIAWVSIHTATDNGYDRLMEYLEHNVPLGSRVAVGDELQDLLLDNRYTTGKWVTPESIRINHAQYAVISAKNVEKGYGFARLPFYRWLMSNATLIFSFHGKRYGVLSVYAIPDDSPPAVTDYPRETTPDVPSNGTATVAPDIVAMPTASIPLLTSSPSNATPTPRPPLSTPPPARGYTPTPSLRIHEDPQHRFSFSLPDGWQIQPSAQPIVAVQVVVGATRANVKIAIESVGGRPTLDQYVMTTLGAIVGQYPRYRLAPPGIQQTVIANHPAERYDLQGESENVPVRVTQIVTLIGDSAYVITFTSLESDHEAFVREGKVLLNTFVVLADTS